MADKRISQLIERTDILNNDVLPIVASGATTTNKVTISTIQEWMQDNLDVGVTSVGITVGTSGSDVNVTGSPITTSGNITINIPTASATNRGLLSAADWSTFTNDRVPYTGATGAVNLGTHAFAAAQININGNAPTSGSYLGFKHSTNVLSGADGYTSMYTFGTNTIAFKSVSGATTKDFSFSMVGITAGVSGGRQYTLPDASGTLALTSDLSGYVTLGTAQTITATKTFTTSGSGNTININHTSGSGHGLEINKAGNGEGLRVIKTSGTGNAVTISGGLLSAEAATLTGALNGTSASFTGGVNAGITSGRSYYANHTSAYSILFSQINAANTIAFDNNAGDLQVYTGGANRFSIASTGAATFSSSGIANATTKFAVNGAGLISSFGSTGSGTDNYIRFVGNTNNFDVGINGTSWGVADAGVAYRFLITQSGNVGIGTASPSSRLEVSSSAFNVATFNSTFGQMAISFANSGTTFSQIGSGVSVCSTAAADDLGFGTAGLNKNIVFATGSGYLERMRITSGGSILFGTQTMSTTHAYFDNAGSSRMVLNLGSSVTTNANLIAFNNPNGNVGTIATSGSSTSYNTTSDYRLKENVNPVQNALSVLTQLKPCTFNFIADAEEEVMGFIAHEVQEIVPQAVTGEKDAVRIQQVEVSPAELDEEGNIITEAVIEEKQIPVYQGIDHSKLVPLLVAAMQEQQEQIKELRAEIEALKLK